MCRQYRIFFGKILFLLSCLSVWGILSAQIPAEARTTTKKLVKEKLLKKAIAKKYMNGCLRILSGRGL